MKQVVCRVIVGENTSTMGEGKGNNNAVGDDDGSLMLYSPIGRLALVVDATCFPGDFERVGRDNAIAIPLKRIKTWHMRRGSVECLKKSGGGVEKQYRWCCNLSGLPLAYQCAPWSSKGKAKEPADGAERGPIPEDYLYVFDGFMGSDATFMLNKNSNKSAAGADNNVNAANDFLVDSRGKRHY